MSEETSTPFDTLFGTGDVHPRLKEMDVPALIREERSIEQQLNDPDVRQLPGVDPFKTLLTSELLQARHQRAELEGRNEPTVISLPPGYDAEAKRAEWEKKTADKKFELYNHGQRLQRGLEPLAYADEIPTDDSFLDDGGGEAT